ncbi:MAG: alpha/beta hydrolase [Ardenticatenaceae bacterium]|nr:alpha/beta hydrolase [Anaerolineales bacterium]MCB8921450.1 alpha/beta hydrolase [Ardenticatenaceae bacterium]MCB8991567.1 alpha/beta hydrolase [Ardenticatenaceae bacterium]
MKKLRRFVSRTVFIWGLFANLPPSFFLVKQMPWLDVLARALSPVTAVLSILITPLNIWRRDGLASLMGLLGGGLALRHIQQTTAPQDDHFSAAFGPDWQSHIPAEVASRMQQRRYTPLPPTPPQADWQRDVVIGRHEETGDPLLADLWQPAVGVPRSGLAILYLHGSAWHYLDKDYGTRPFFNHLAAQGHVVLDVAYTLAPKAQLRAMVADVKRAIVWLKENAPRLQTSKVVLMGGSAGGHLAMLAGFTPNHPVFQPDDVGDADTSVTAVVSFYGISDMVGLHEDMAAMKSPPAEMEAPVTRFFRRIRLLPPDGEFTAPAQFMPNLLGGLPDEVPGEYQIGSPLAHMGRQCPPTLLINGAHDFGVYTYHHREVYAGLRKLGVTAVHIELPLTEHGFDLIFPRISPAAQSAWYDTDRFLGLVAGSW